eukprot:comp19224_c0_seq2/m.35977 comp19224_c0_seq2/g.35977  ORF comp19224_c0_seq2/g.35977 comp19224_c0_seq2/m.35977 type:complete len:132 (+) comp19224_c0_seq2:62-457(+)
MSECRIKSKYFSPFFPLFFFFSTRDREFNLSLSLLLLKEKKKIIPINQAAVEVNGEEWSYGETDDDETGVFSCEPKKCDMHTYRETVVLGETSLSADQINKLLEAFRFNWRGKDYNTLKNNCCTFCDAFAV